MIRKVYNYLKERCGHYLSKRPVSRWPMILRVRQAMRQYNANEGHTFDLSAPKLFTEKIVWYKLFYRHRDMTRIYDKYLFKDYIAEKLGPGYTAKLYGMWTDVRELERDWDSLPDTFCLKSNCSSLGQNIRFIFDKQYVEKQSLFMEVSEWLDPLNTGINSYNWAYRKITPRIIAEELLVGKAGLPGDYKILCFDGIPSYIVCVSDRFIKGKNPSESIYDTAWNKLPVVRRGRQNRNYEQPQYLQQMLKLSAKLSKGFPQIRVDFYETKDKLYIGELTLYAGTQFESPEWDKRFGERFILPKSALANTMGFLQKIKRRVYRWFQKPISKWPIDKRVDRAMRNYTLLHGHSFDLAHPVLFTEKREWYRLFYKHPDMIRIYDKYLFKAYIEEKLGPGWTAPIYGMWTRVRDLERDWDSLPNSFCLKSNCSSLGKNVVFVRDKNCVDTKALFQKVKSWLDPMNTMINSCNRAYYGVTPRIMAEKLLTAKDEQLYDYKVMCFGGKPDHILATADRFPLEADNLAYTFYDLAWNKLPVTTPGHENRDVPCPEHLEEMIKVAERLSKGFPHIRVDFYDTTDGLRIGEMTLYSSPTYEQREWDLRLGELFVLPNTERT